MGQGKKKQRQQEQQQQQQQQQCEGNDSTESNTENANEENKKKPKGPIVLGAYIHCQGCGDDVIKCLRGFEGVEEIEIDAKNNKVMVKGPNADPVKVAERLRKKSGKHVVLISPIPTKAKKEEKKEPKKQANVVEVVLKVYLHCEGCAKEVKYCIHKMPGVQTVEPDFAKNLVTVKGVIEAEKLVEFISKRGGRHAEIVKAEKKKQNNSEKNENENENEGGGGERGGQNNNNVIINYQPHDFVHASQLFSDENPNSCSVM